MSVIETTTFRLTDASDEQQFLEADAALQSGFAYQQTGLARRTTARRDDGVWIVIEIWSDGAAADGAAAERPGSPLVAAYDAMIDHDSLETSRWAALD